MQIAQINIAQMLAPLDSTTMKEFHDFLGPINLLAESSPGFVWRYRDEDHPDAAAPWDDNMLVVNMSVWASLEELQEFTYKTVHSYFIRSRKRWFHQLGHPHTVLWWVEDGHIPTLEEGKARLEQLERDGPTAAGFLFAQANSFKP